jgi:hypothetical protein
MILHFFLAKIKPLIDWLSKTFLRHLLDQKPIAT